MISVKNLVKVYDARGIAGIRDLSLQLVEGEIAAIMGPNGSGKSTLLNLISGKLEADSGEVRLGGDVAVFEPQNAPTSGNVLAFLISSITVTQDEEKKVQLARDLADLMEFTFQLRQDLSSLSTGQKQKILLASLLINRPKLVLLDEPFAHLDPFTRHDILNSLFAHLCRLQVAVLWVTHDLDEALKLADWLGVMNFGKLAQWDEPAKLLFSPANLFVAQFLGYKNFVHAKKNEKNWSTAFGEWDFGPAPHHHEAYLVIPQTAWRITKDGFSLLVKNFTLCPHYWLVECQMEDKSYFIQLNQSQYAEFRSKKELSALPIFSECFLIPV